MKYFAFGFAILFWTSCKTDKKMETVVAEPSNGVTAYYGDTIQTEGSISVNEALEALKTKDSILTKVTGYVTGVCQVKGCWMVLSQTPDDSTGLFVKFKDYGFFVPKDLSGSKITLDGKAFKQITPVDELKHYAEDEGKSAEEIAKITQPTEEMKFLAHGVAVLKK